MPKPLANHKALEGNTTYGTSDQPTTHHGFWRRPGQLSDVQHRRLYGMETYLSCSCVTIWTSAANNDSYFAGVTASAKNRSRYCGTRNWEAPMSVSSTTPGDTAHQSSPVHQGSRSQPDRDGWIIQRNRKRERREELKRQEEAATKFSEEKHMSGLYMQFWTKDLNVLKARAENHLTLAQTVWGNESVFFRFLKVQQSDHPMNTNIYESVVDKTPPIVESSGVDWEGGFGVENGTLTFTKPTPRNTASSGQS